MLAQCNITCGYLWVMIQFQTEIKHSLGHFNNAIFSRYIILPSGVDLLFFLYSCTELGTEKTVLFQNNLFQDILFLRELWNQPDRKG